MARGDPSVARRSFPLCGHQGDSPAKTVLAGWATPCAGGQVAPLGSGSEGRAGMAGSVHPLCPASAQCMQAHIPGTSKCRYATGWKVEKSLFKAAAMSLGLEESSPEERIHKAVIQL